MTPVRCTLLSLSPSLQLSLSLCLHLGEIVAQLLLRANQSLLGHVGEELNQW